METKVDNEGFAQVMDKSLTMKMAVMSIHGIELTKNAKERSKPFTNLAHFIASRYPELINTVINPIQEKRLERLRIRINNAELEAKLTDSQNDLQYTSLYLLNLQLGSFGEEALVNTLAYCTSCMTDVHVEEDCKNCDGGYKREIFRYRSPVCFCQWRGDKSDRFCNMCILAAYVPRILLESHQKVPFTNPVNIYETYCYTTMESLFVILPTEGFTCTSCFLKTTDMTRRVKRGNFHLTTLLNLKLEKCLICETNIFIRKSPRHCPNCRRNCTLRRQILRVSNHVVSPAIPEKYNR